MINDIKQILAKAMFEAELEDGCMGVNKLTYDAVSDRCKETLKCMAQACLVKLSTLPLPQNALEAAKATYFDVCITEENADKWSSQHAALEAAIQAFLKTLVEEPHGTK